jgi:hypothetical protein
MKPTVNSEGIAEFIMPVKPETLFPIVDPRDFGHIVLALLKNPTKYYGKKVLAASEEITMPNLAETYTRGTSGDPYKLEDYISNTISIDLQ